MPVRDLRSMSTWLKIALACLTLGVLLFVIGFATEAWMTSYAGYRHGSSYHTTGLWKYKACHYNDYGCRSVKYNSAVLPDFHKASQAMECLGLISLLLAFLILLLYIFVDSCRRRDAMIATIVFIFLAVLFMVIGFVVFATKYEERGYEIAWSMGLAIAGCICTFIAGVMCILHISAR